MPFASLILRTRARLAADSRRRHGVAVAAFQTRDVKVAQTLAAQCLETLLNLGCKVLPLRERPDDLLRRHESSRTTVPTEPRAPFHGASMGHGDIPGKPFNKILVERAWCHPGHILEDVRIATRHRQVRS